MCTPCCLLHCAAVEAVTIGVSGKADDIGALSDECVLYCKQNRAFRFRTSLTCDATHETWHVSPPLAQPDAVAAARFDVRNGALSCELSSGERSGRGADDKVGATRVRAWTPGHGASLLTRRAGDLKRVAPSEGFYCLCGYICRVV